jgi:predicted NAD-dependent protein-ADP-ribosyltransferase YbiA (DUF1768 family)
LTNADFLSNAHWADVLFEEHVYPTVEHALQAAKTRSVVQRERIRRAPTPAQARHLGQRARQRQDWETLKLPVLLALVRQKFDPLMHPELAQKLLATGDAPLTSEDTDLARILTQVRAELQNHSAGAYR